MFMKQMACVIGLIICSPAFAADQKKPEPAAAASTPAELQKQLIATANDGRRLASEAYRSGQGTEQEVLSWTRRWLDARLKAATTKQERIAILIEAVRVAKEQEGDLRKRQDAGIAKSTDIVAAHYDRIEAELALAMEQAK
jgi:outer membrane protein TolC